VNCSVNVIADDLDPTVAKEHVATTDMGTAEAVPVDKAPLVVERWLERAAAGVHEEGDESRQPYR
jgi:hypothetical protein